MVQTNNGAVKGPEIAVEVHDLRKTYGKLEALKGVTLEVEKGSIFGLLGENGAGKSTMIRILVGSSKNSGGTVRVLGLDPIKANGKLRSICGYMPQETALYEDLTARENISFFGAPHNIADLSKRIDEVLKFTSLSDRQNDPVYSFSGGMKQRVSLCCALVHQPQILFLDEPTAGIDPKLREAFWQHFRQLAEQGHTLFISTHQMDEALLCDKLAIMRRGVILASDTPRNIMLKGNARVQIQRGDKTETFTVTNYPEQLPLLLRQYQLDPNIKKIDIEEDTLETIVLNLINNHPEQTTKEATYV
jgi:ABC-2 type transport system ATP-binding protein